MPGVQHGEKRPTDSRIMPVDAACDAFTGVMLSLEPDAHCSRRSRARTVCWLFFPPCTWLSRACRPAGIIHTSSSISGVFADIDPVPAGHSLTKISCCRTLLAISAPAAIKLRSSRFPAPYFLVFLSCIFDHWLRGAQTEPDKMFSAPVIRGGVFRQDYATTRAARENLFDSVRQVRLTTRRSLKSGPHRLLVRPAAVH
jgi:hypothetical protein